jgi:hypothetical protein
MLLRHLKQLLFRLLKLLPGRFDKLLSKLLLKLLNKLLLRLLKKLLLRLLNKLLTNCYPLAHFWMSPSETAAVVNLKSSRSQQLSHMLTALAQAQSCNTRWHLHNKLAAVAQEPSYTNPYQLADPLFGISCIDMKVWQTRL